MKSISKSQFLEIREAYVFGADGFHKKLEEITGITARPYTAFLYYDSSGDYIGDSENSRLYDLLNAAYIEVIDE